MDSACSGCPCRCALGHDKSVACPSLTLHAGAFHHSCDWRISDLGWIYTLFFVLLGLRLPFGAAGWNAPDPARRGSTGVFAGAARHAGDPAKAAGVRAASASG